MLAIDTDIALSEDPAISFALVPDGPGTLAVEARDSKERLFRQSWELGAGS